MTGKEQEQDLTAAILTHYDRHKRKLPWRDTGNPYYIWLSEIMLQQTRVEAVKGYFTRFVAELPDIQALAACEEDRLLKLWEGLGYYSRARNLKKAAGQIMAEHHGRLPETKAELLRLAGIGEYTAAAIAAIAFGQPEVALDGNLIRVFSRIWAWAEDFSGQKAKNELRAKIYPYLPATRPGDFNQAVMDIGALICLPNGQPLCGQCPAAHFCQANAAGEAVRYPLKKAKKSRKTEARTILVIQRGSTVRLHRRTEKGVLAGLWEFPGLAGHCGQEEIREWLAEHFSVLAAVTAEIEMLPVSRHIFSHLEWDMTAYWIYLPEPDMTDMTGESFFDCLGAARMEGETEPAAKAESDLSRFSLTPSQELLAEAEAGVIYHSQAGAAAAAEAGGQALELASRTAIWADSQMIRRELSLPSAFKLYQQEALKRLE